MTEGWRRHGQGWWLERRRGGNRGFRTSRCDRCRLPGAACLCDELPSAPTEVAFGTTLVVHQLELARPSNTSFLIPEFVRPVSLVVHGRDRTEAPPPAGSLVLHPEGRPLTAADREADLVVPDGTWSQVRRMRQRLPWMRNLEMVAIRAKSTARSVRTAPDEERTSTALAFARVLHVFGYAELSAELEGIVHAFGAASVSHRRGER
ncbi:MAG: DTW domain-containing protein [Myxococcota bacterium]